MTTKKLNQIINGKKVGEWITYHDNGTVKEIGEYINGEKIGLWEEYYNNGVICSREEYSNGRVEGKWWVFYRSGKLEAVGKFKNDKIEGKCIRYYENGVVEEKGSYNGNELDGKWKYFYESGKIKRVAYFDNGQEVERPEKLTYLYNLIKSLKHKKLQFTLIQKIITASLLLLLVITNPNPSDFKTYLQAMKQVFYEKGIGREYNFLIFSIYVNNSGTTEEKTKYIGFLKNFHLISE
jgi:hypothetical protein